MKIEEEFEPNANGWHKLRGKHTYRVATTKTGNCVIECDTGEAMVVDYDKWFSRKEGIDEFWDKNF